MAACGRLRAESVPDALCVGVSLPVPYVLLRRDVSGDTLALPPVGVRSSMVVSLCEELQMFRRV
jgi:hypothetical protein